MIQFNTVLKKFTQKGEKSGWVYIEIPALLAEKLNPGVKVAYRVKGKINDHIICLTAILPMGGGDFILPTNSEIRKKIRRQEGALVTVELEIDDTPLQLSEDLMECLTDVPEALAYFNTLPGSHQNYFSKWIESAKTVDTRARRISQAVQGLSLGMGYPETIRYFRKKAEK